jgi:hypothetical protein
MRKGMSGAIFMQCVSDIQKENPKEWGQKQVRDNTNKYERI